MTPHPWKPRRPVSANEIRPLSGEAFAVARRKEWRTLIELARELVEDPSGDPMHLVHHAIVMRAGRQRSPDPAFVGVGGLGEQMGAVLIDAALAVKAAGAARQAQTVPALRALADLVEDLLVESQTHAADRWRAQLGD
jgi:hypothetical protein